MQHIMLALFQLRSRVVDLHDYDNKKKWKPKCTNFSFGSFERERESNPTQSDMDTYWKQAECLGIKRETQYSYDGVPGQRTQSEPKLYGLNPIGLMRFNYINIMWWPIKNLFQYYVNINIILLWLHISENTYTYKIFS